VGKIAGHKDLDAQSAQMWQLQDRVQHRRKRRERDHQDVQNGSSASGPAECAIPDAEETSRERSPRCTERQQCKRPGRVCHSGRCHQHCRRHDGTANNATQKKAPDRPRCSSGGSTQAQLNNLPGARLMFSPRWVRECVCRSGAGVTTATAVVGERLCACGCVYVGRCTCA